MIQEAPFYEETIKLGRELIKNLSAKQHQDQEDLSHALFLSLP